MENKPRKSKALIITIIILLVVILLGYLLFKNVKNSSSNNNLISRIFSSLSPSNNKKNEKVQAGENIQKGDSVTKVGTATDGSPVVIKSKNGSKIYGIASEDITNGEFGEIIISASEIDGFLNSFSGFINDIFTNDIGEITPPGGEITPPGGDIIVTPDNYECSDTIDNDGDEKIDADDPECHVDGDLEKEYLPNNDSESGTTNPGELTPVDLTAGAVSPTSTTTNTLTTLSATISNTGGMATEKSFYGFFTITNITRDDIQIETENTNVASSKIKKFISKIVAKIPWISTKKTIAENTIEVNTLLDPLVGESNTVASIFYTFDQAGTYYIRACADKSSTNDVGVISESDEENNCGTWTTFTVSDTLPIVGEGKQCSDLIDNDGDEKIDADDPECHVDGDLEKEYLPEHDSEGFGSTTYQCSDLVDNDGDEKIDADDPECHINGNLDNDYVPENDSESSAPIGPEENKCLLIEQNPLTFTDAEKAELANLLRKFYLIAPTLKTQDDIDMIYTEMSNYKNFISRIDELTAQCYVESVDKNGIVGGHMQGDKWIQYSGPTTRYGNPWYMSNTRGSYIGSSIPIEKSYCYDCGNSCDTHDLDLNCSIRVTKFECEVYDPTGDALVSGCKWIDATNIKEYEEILNIW